MASLFDKLQAGAFRAGLTPRTDASRKWFQKKVKELGTINTTKLMNDDSLKETANPKVGDMIMYMYDAKTKADLPYWDAFPLTILVGPTKGGFQGINLHYLPPKVRAIFLDKLNDITNNQKFDKTTRFKVTYKLLQSTANYKYFKPCFKHYLTKNVTSNIMKVNAAEWNIAIFLKTASFKGASTGTVWADSKRGYG